MAEHGMRSAVEVQTLWERFHEVVTMTSSELRAWLGTKPDLDPVPGPTGPPSLGLAVLDVLSKRRTDLTEHDLEVMMRVVEVVEEETEGLSQEAIAADERRRHRLLSIGHDPLRSS